MVELLELVAIISAVISIIGACVSAGLYIACYLFLRAEWKNRKDANE